MKRLSPLLILGFLSLGTFAAQFLATVSHAELAPDSIQFTPTEDGSMRIHLSGSTVEALMKFIKKNKLQGLVTCAKDQALEDFYQMKSTHCTFTLGKDGVLQ